MSGAMPPMGMGGPPMAMGGPQAVPPGAIPNPAYAEWEKQQQTAMLIQQDNDKKTQQFMAACELIRKDGARGFRLDIEADSTIAPDEQAEKQARVEFLQQMIPMLQQVVPVAQGNPALAALSKELTLFAARGFRVARPLEETIEQAFDAIGKMPPEPKPEEKPAAAGPDPQIEVAKAQASAHDTESKAQTERMAIAQKQQQAQIEAQTERERLAAEDQWQRTQAMIDAAALAIKQREADGKDRDRELRSVEGFSE